MSGAARAAGGIVSSLQERVARLSPERRALLEALAGRVERDSPSLPAGPPADAGTGGPPPWLPPGPLLGPLPRQSAAPEASGSGLARRREVRGFYDRVNRQLSDSGFAEHALFLNFGYVPNESGSQARVLPPPHAVNRNSMRLVLEVAGDCPLSAGSSVLEVGCGRGGALAVLSGCFGVRRIAGADLSLSALAFAGRGRRPPAGRLLAADAQALPLRSASFDVAFNLESSHCYPDRAEFYREVHRLLRPGGHFLYADLLPAGELAGCRESLAALGFACEREIDITGNVLLSCDETARVRARAFGGGAALDDAAAFVGVPGSPLYEAMKHGEQRYMSWKLRREAAPGSLAG
ncbi:MAG TPA: class I SAM-dependent methyltransferase [Thermoanaerobaculia bacterium]